ncbi:trehalose-phosphatase [Pseudochrobactrum asaccharolyticum]|uniref:Trehalose 6-phosphate phosphatase n=1 Tax=Pseudochrobactrum asaccharolyticum TaxID=354351 RepID=A0A366E1Q7_9HYPH|nr:trehalose-phosphatase [Pseudochrobactrum asaccharolyticum]RBO95444.1 trehalose 6-phosphatase [Pseudochrobactrum asaccharolyticum]
MSTTLTRENIEYNQGLIPELSHLKNDKGSLSKHAFFFDLDGTLLDIASAPDKIQLPQQLYDILSHLHWHLDGALALITGRPVSFVDTIFPSHSFEIAGLHGAQIRNSDGSIRALKIDDRFRAAKRYIEDTLTDYPDIKLEDKEVALALHYRSNPRLQKTTKDIINKAASITGDNWTVQHGKMVAELRPAGSDKGSALDHFMAKPAFQSRIPIAFGDDLTDEAMFAAAHKYSGASAKIGASLQQSCAMSLISSPSALRNWLTEVIAAQGTLRVPDPAINHPTNKV